MKKLIYINILLGFMFSSNLYAAASKSELCDLAINTVRSMLAQSGNSEIENAFTKEKCMSISDEELKSAVAQLKSLSKNNNSQ